MKPRSPGQVPFFRRLGLFVLFLYGAAIALFVYTVHGSRSASPFRLPYEAIIHAKLWMPQGWQFFTRSAREEWPRAFARNAQGEWVAAESSLRTTPASAIGLSRRARAMGLEVGCLIQGLPPSAWTPCNEEPAACLEEMPPLDAVTVTPGAILVGDVGIVLQEPVPWAWSGRGGNVVMPSRVVRFDVRAP